MATAATAPAAATVQVHWHGKKTRTILCCAGHDRIISSGIPSDIIDTRDTTDIIDTLGTIGVFHPAPFGIVDILDAFDYTSTWSSTRRRHGSGESPRHLCLSSLPPFIIFILC